MSLANYWNFLKNLRRTGPGSPPRRRKMSPWQRSHALACFAETLEVRVVPAALPFLSIAPAISVAEGDADTEPAVFTVTLSAASLNPVTVDFTTFDATATINDGDYEPKSGTLTFAPGETSKTISVDVYGDTTRELDETFSVFLFNPANAKLRSRESTGTGTITNDDDAPSFSIGTPATVFEGNSGTKVITFPVTLSNPSDQPLSVHFATADGTSTIADNDYNAATGTLTFAPGETTKNISVTIKGDTKVETDETFTVTLSAPSTSTTITTATATGTIGDDDTTPTLSVNNPAPINESNTGTVTMLFTVTLSSASTQTVTVAYTTADGTATIADNDYITKTGTLTFAPGETSKIIQVVIKGDTRNENNETVLLTLSAPTNAQLAAATGTGTITTDDETLIFINVGSGATVTEGNSGTVDVTFQLTLSQASGQTVTVSVGTADGTATTADNDYIAANGTVTFAPGETTKSFVVQVKGDTKFEANETLKLNLTNAVNADIATPQQTATITNDDGGTVSIAKTTDGAETSPPTKGKFTVTQSGVSSEDTVVSYTIEGTATPGDDGDYQELTGTVTIPAGQTTAIIDVNVLNDEEEEDVETVIVTLTDVATDDENIQLDSDEDKLTATVNIADAADLPGLVLGGPAVTFTKQPIAVLPLVTVSQTGLAGSTLSISVNAVSNSKKLLDKFKFPSTKNLGTTTGAHVVNGQLTMTIDLSQNVTAAAVQAFLRGITFSTKLEGLQTATRTMNVSLTDAGNHTSAITQTINIAQP